MSAIAIILPANASIPRGVNAKVLARGPTTFRFESHYAMSVPIELNWLVRTKDCE